MTALLGGWSIFGSGVDYIAARHLRSDLYKIILLG